MRLLALETSGRFCSVAIQNGHAIYEIQEQVPQQHAQVILEWLAQLLKDADLNLKNLDALSYSCGPGGFTGIRIAASMIQGIAFTMDVPVLAIPSLQVIAQGVHREFKAEEVLILQDARMEQVYYGHYSLGTNDLMLPLQPDRMCQIMDLNSCLRPNQQGWLVSDLANISEIVGFNKMTDNLHVLTDYQPKARDVLALAAQRFREGAFVEVEQALPIYLRSETHWKKL